MKVLETIQILLFEMSDKLKKINIVRMKAVGSNRLIYLMPETIKKNRSTVKVLVILLPPNILNGNNKRTKS